MQDDFVEFIFAKCCNSDDFERDVNEMINKIAVPQITKDNSGEYFGQLSVDCLAEILNWLSWPEIMQLAVVNVEFYTTLYLGQWCYQNTMTLTDIDSLVVHGGEYLCSKCRKITNIVVNGNELIEQETLDFLAGCKNIIKVAISDNIVTSKGKYQAAKVINQLLKHGEEIMEFKFSCDVLMNGIFYKKNCTHESIWSDIINVLNIKQVEKLFVVVSGPTGSKIADHYLGALNLDKVKELHLTFEGASTNCLKQIVVHINGTNVFIQIRGEVFFTLASEWINGIEYFINKTKPMNCLKHIQKVHQVRFGWKLIVPYGVQLTDLESRVQKILKTNPHVHMMFS